MDFAAKLSEVPNFGKKQVSVKGTEVIIYNIKGELFAIESECPHQGAPLESAIIKDGYISCPRHGYRFDLKTGNCKDHPEFTLKVYPVQVIDGNIMIKID